MNRGLVRVFVLVILAMSSGAAAEQAHQWKTGTVISQQLTSDSNTVAVIAGAHSYVWQEVSPSTAPHHFIVLVHDQTVREQVKFYREGQWFVILDDEGKKHQFRLMRSATNE